MILKNALGIKSMREMTVEFNNNKCIENIKKMLKIESLEEIPHYDTINDFLCKLENNELEKIRDYMIKELLKKRSLEQYRYQEKYWLIAVDATGISYFRERHCKHCTKKEFKDKETGEIIRTGYYHNVLEAKLVLGDMVFSLATEFIENEDETVSKQDCEVNAFKRLEKKIKSKYPRLPICILGDSLYACEPVFEICDKNRWKFLFGFKDGRIKTVAAEFYELKEYDKTEHEGCTWINEISYNKRRANVVEMKRVEKDKEKYFLFITNLHVTKKKVAGIVTAGRSRWKIENEGFNNQKNNRYNIEHANSSNYNAMRNHYLLVQITDIIRQLFELGAIKVRGFKKA
ncbi:MAG: transposase [Alkaliphilus sp.]